MISNRLNQQRLPAQASVHLYIPLYTFHPVQFRKRLLRTVVWRPVTPDTRFYTRYVERIFRGDDPTNVNALTVNCLMLQNKTLHEALSVRGTPVSLDGVGLYCFDTSIAFLDFHLTVESNDLNTITDVCSALRFTDTEVLRQLPTTEGEGENTPTYESVSFNALADRILRPFGKYRLFDHLGRAGTTRADLYVTVIAEEKAVQDPNMIIYRIASGFDSRYRNEIPENAIFSRHAHIRWAITSKGACSVGLLTSDSANRSFVQNQWMELSERRHVLWYMLAMHQKYAMFHYLNDIAERNDLAGVRSYQRRIVLFNARYRFEVIAEDPTYQLPYQMARDAKSVEPVFEDIDEKIERINDYHNLTSDKNNVVAMTIVSLVCAISTFIDIFEWGSGGIPIIELFGTMTADRWILFAVIVLAMSVAIVFLVIKPLAQWLFNRIKKVCYRFLERFFYH